MHDAPYTPIGMAAAQLSVIIPTLNAANHLRDALASVDGACETIVVDGGSADATREVAARAGATVVTAPKGRGSQLAAGARLAAGDWFLFLHADTRLAPTWSDEVEAFMAEPKNSARAAAFRFALDVPSPQARRLERLVAWRCSIFALPYGDQGLLISRKFYDRLGGYRPLPIMEDVDIVRRIGRHNLAMLETPAMTSSERWQREGWRRRSLRNLACLSLYGMGVSPRVIARTYGA